MQAVRGIVIASTIVAALAESYLATQFHPIVFWFSIIGFAVLLVVGERVRNIALPAMAAAMYLTPAFFIAIDPARQAEFSLDIVWVLPLLGLSLSGAELRWSLPQRIQWPLIIWSLVVAVSWPLVFLREADFALWILPLQRV